MLHHSDLVIKSKSIGKRSSIFIPKRNKGSINNRGKVYLYVFFTSNNRFVNRKCHYLPISMFHFFRKNTYTRGIINDLLSILKLHFTNVHFKAY